MKAQVVTIALVVASGIGTYTGALSTYESLKVAKEAFYQESRFAHIFASLRRAPLSVAGRIGSLPGVQAVQTRIEYDSLLELPDASEPVVGRFLSLPDPGEIPLNQIYLRKGHLPSPDDPTGVLVTESFANANRLKPGDSIAGLFQGNYRDLRITGLALAPDYIYASRGMNPLPDDRHFGVFWMPRRPLASATQMEGAFNQVNLLLKPGTSRSDVIRRLDEILDSYGGFGAYERKEQPSDSFISNEIEQQWVMATFVPGIFLGVAAFLVNVVIGRLVQTQREQIATLKAVGYSSTEVALHYGTMVTIIIVLGAVIGVGLGILFGKGMTKMYLDFFRFPSLDLMIPPYIPVSAIAVSLSASLAGGASVLFRVLKMAPAEAMRPPAPPVYRHAPDEFLGIKKYLAISARLALRNFALRPFRTMLSLLGISFAMVTVILGSFWWDSLDMMIDMQIGHIQREDTTVYFRMPIRERAIREIEHLPGVLGAEGYRSLPVRLHAGPLFKNVLIQGIPAASQLRTIRRPDLSRIRPPEGGLLLDREMARYLSLKRGDTVEVEILEGERRRASLVVTGVVEQFLGTSAWMERASLNRFLREGDLVNQAALIVDPKLEQELYQQLGKLPAVESIASMEATLRIIEQTMTGMVNAIAGILVAFAVTIAFGVVYNTARISLSERAWELATLRVLGFSKGEVFSILATELGMQTVAALAPGSVLGYLFAALTIRMMPMEEGIRLPFVISSASFAAAIVTVLVSALISGFFIRIRINRLDMISVLKVRE